MLEYFNVFRKWRKKKSFKNLIKKIENNYISLSYEYRWKILIMSKWYLDELKGYNLLWLLGFVYKCKNELILWNLLIILYL